MIGTVFEFVTSLPPKELHPNARPHWAAKAKAAKLYRSTVLVDVISALSDIPSRMGKATLSLHYFVPTAHDHDDDNLAAWFKAGRDGLADAGLVANDKDIRLKEVKFEKDAARPRLVVRLEQTA